MVTFQKLVKMGFDDKLSMQSVQKYHDKIEHCIEYILQQQSQKLASSPSSKAAVTTYKQRIDDILDIQSKMDNTQQQKQQYDANKDIYDVIAEYYSSKGGIGIFFTDYEQYIDNLDKHKLYKGEEDDMKCDMMKCKSLFRNFSSRKHRLSVYSFCNDDKSMVIQQHIDILHVLKHHLINIGARAEENDDVKEEYIGDKS